MDRNEILHIAKRYAIAAERILRWRHTFGHNRLKQVRPKGMYSIGDIVRKYKIQARTLRQWRQIGLPSTPGKGKLVLIKESDLRAWIATHRPG